MSAHQPTRAAAHTSPGNLALVGSFVTLAWTAALVGWCATAGSCGHMTVIEFEDTGAVDSSDDSDTD